MAFVAAAIITGSVLGAGSSMYAANQANQGGGPDPQYAATSIRMANLDFEGSQDMMDIWKYGTIDPFGDSVRPYTSSMQEGKGYYVDKKTGKTISKEEYSRRTKDGQKNMKKFSKKVEWVPFDQSQMPSTEGSHYDLEQRQLAVAHDKFDDLVSFAEKQLDLETKRMGFESEALEGRYAAEAATNQYTVDTQPVKAATEIASMEEKQRLIGLRAPAMSEYFGKVMEGIDPTNQMNSATAEVMKANDATKAGMRRDAMAMGVLPGSARYESMMKEDRNETVGAIADARMAAKNNAEETSFQRLAGAMGAGGGVQG